MPISIHLLALILVPVLPRLLQLLLRRRRRGLIISFHVVVGGDGIGGVGAVGAVGAVVVVGGGGGVLRW